MSSTDSVMKGNLGLAAASAAVETYKLHFWGHELVAFRLSQ